MLRATGYILKNFLQDFKHEKFPATGRSHGRVGFHALLPREVICNKRAGMEMWKTYGV